MTSDNTHVGFLFTVSENESYFSGLSNAVGKPIWQVKEELANKLASTPDFQNLRLASYHLVIYKPGSEQDFKPGDTLPNLSNFEGTFSHKFITRLKSADEPAGIGAVEETVEDRLTKLQVSFRTEAVASLLKCDPTSYSILKMPGLTKKEAESIISAAESRLLTNTRNAIGIHHGVFLDCPLTREGNGKSSICFAFTCRGKVQAAKIYVGSRVAFDREVEMLTNFGGRNNIVQLIQSFSYLKENGQYSCHVIVMPFYARSAEEFRKMITDDLRVALFPAIVTIARDCFQALQYLHSQRICYGDLKPANIMLKAEPEEGAVLIDLASAVRFGSPLLEYTPRYCLDLQFNVQCASGEFDWCCLGTTLCDLARVPIKESRIQMKEILDYELSSFDQTLGLAIKACIQSPSTSTVKNAVNALCGCPDALASINH